MKQRPQRVPLSTYRLQFGPRFGLADAIRIVPYLAALGISDVYCSPLLASRPGSAHGYDVVDPTRIDPEIGTEEELEVLAAELRRRDMGLVLDIVPNHMAATPENPWWSDVLEHGPESRFASFFDIEWNPTTGVANVENKVLLPILGQRYWQAVESRDLRLEFGAGGFVLRYFDSQFPLSLASYPAVFSLCRNEMLGGARGRAAIDAVIGSIRGGDLHDADRKRRVNRTLWRLHERNAPARAAIDSCVEAFNGERDRLDALLDQQAYRLIYWRRATSDINYRRFFDITDLVGIRVERGEVFAAVHRKVLEWIGRGIVTGLRIDHLDGLRDPAGYLARLQEAARESADSPVYVVVEKILAPGEDLPPSLATAGTTGYDFLNEATGALLDSRGTAQLFAVYQRFTGSSESFEDVAYRRKKQVIATLFAGDLRMLGNQLLAFAREHRTLRYASSREIVQALIEISASLPVYRTYMRSGELPEADEKYLDAAVEEARRRNPLEPRIYDFVRALLAGRDAELPPEAEPARFDFMMRWQQFTGPVTAKGVEDTAFYGYSPLLALNEVGGEPKVPALPGSQRFHRFQSARVASWPHAMSASSTHDTKRSEDARARLAVLSEIPAEWEKALAQWSRMGQKYRKTIGGNDAPSRAEEIHIYQALLAVWPLEEREARSVPRRLSEYVVKALREAKIHSSWIEPNEDYEKVVVGFVRALLRDQPFRRGFLRMQSRIALAGAVNALSQLVLKIAAPGVPDFYQGTDLWTFSLVDPDNRRPVDFRLRERALRRIASQRNPPRPGDLLKGWTDGRLKLIVTAKGLDVRKRRPALFLDGDYRELPVQGARRESAMAFARMRESEWVIAVVPRLVTRLGGSGRWPVGKMWGATTVNLPEGAPRAWRNAFTGETVRAGRSGRLRLTEVLGTFPVAMLENVE